MEAEVGNTDKVKARNRYGDPWIWGIYCTLCLVSVVEAFSASIQQVGTAGIYGPIGKHVVTLLVGAAALFVTQLISFKRKVFTWCIVGFAVITLVALVYVMEHGQMINGAMRSLSFFGFSVQPAELAKLATVLLVAFIMSRYQEPGGVRNIGVALSAFVVLLFGGFTYKQGFTNTAILMSISLSMMLIGGVQVKQFIVVLLVYGIAAAGYMAPVPHPGQYPRPPRKAHQRGGFLRASGRKVPTVKCGISKRDEKGASAAKWIFFHREIRRTSGRGLAVRFGAAGCAAVSLCCEFLLAGKGLSFDEKVPLSQHF